ncbi:MAG: glycosyl transferase family 4 [Candidatus Nanoarchaeia archaeon]|nr:glycosyl transferase family 4 [Candidatus Nanoarchaeia archaeon]
MLISFLVAFLLMPSWIKKAKSMGLLWEDMNKSKAEKVAGSGGLIVILAFILGIMFYIFLKTFYFKSPVDVVEIFALTTSILILAGIGVIDDLLGWHRGGLSKKFRLIMCIVASIPLVVINAGNSSVSLPFLDGTALGLIYPLLLIPLAVVGAATTFNFLAGFNGLESGQGIIILTALSFVAYFTGNTWLGLLGLCMVFSLIGFWIFNKFPAKVFPGDVLTYPVGGLIALMAILGNFEKVAVFFFAVYIAEVLLKLRGGLRKQSFGKPNKDGSLEMPYNKIYGMEHFAIWALKKMKKNVYEKDVVWFIWIIQIAVIILGFIIFRESIFKNLVF